MALQTKYLGVCLTPEKHTYIKEAAWRSRLSAGELVKRILTQEAIDHAVTQRQKELEKCTNVQVS